MSSDQQSKATGVVIVAHGSRVAEANEAVFLLARDMQRRLGSADIETAMFSLGEPDVPTVVARLYERGCRDIVMLPFFLAPGKHVAEDIPAIIRECRARHEGLSIDLLDAVGVSPRFADVVEETLAERLLDIESGRPMEPEAIEATSHAIIDERLQGMGVPAEQVATVRRVIHATADFSFAKSLRFHPDAVAAGIDAVRGGRAIVTDVNMPDGDALDLLPAEPAPHVPERSGCPGPGSDCRPCGCGYRPRRSCR